MSGTSRRPGPPLLPPGERIFEELPAVAVVVDALPASVGDGVIAVVHDDAWAVVLCRSGAVAARYCSQPGETVATVQQRPGAVVSARRLAPDGLECVAPLLAGRVVYRDLRPAWTDWAGLLDDVRHRGGRHAVLVRAPSGDGVLLIQDGAESFAFTDSVSDADALQRLASDPAATITVMADPDSSAERVPSSGEWRHAGDDGGDDTPVPHMAGSDRDLDGTFRMFFGDTNAPRQPYAEALATLAPTLKLMARSRLALSSPRLERIIDDAATSQTSLQALADAVRVTSIRGINPETLEDLAQQMLAVQAS